MDIERAFAQLGGTEGVRVIKYTIKYSTALMRFLAKLRLWTRTFMSTMIIGSPTLLV